MKNVFGTILGGFLLWCTGVAAGYWYQEAEHQKAFAELNLEIAKAINNGWSDITKKRETEEDSTKGEEE